MKVEEQDEASDVCRYPFGWYRYRKFTTLGVDAMLSLQYHYSSPVFQSSIFRHESQETALTRLYQHKVLWKYLLFDQTNIGHFCHIR